MIGYITEDGLSHKKVWFWHINQRPKRCIHKCSKLVTWRGGTVIQCRLSVWLQFTALRHAESQPKSNLCKNCRTDRDAAWVLGLDGPDHTMGKGNFGEKGTPIAKYRDCAVSCAGWTEMLFGMMSRVDPRNHVLDGVQIWERAILRAKSIDMPDDILTWAVHKRLNWCGYGLGWA